MVNPLLKSLLGIDTRSPEVFTKRDKTTEFVYKQLERKIIAAAERRYTDPLFPEALEELRRTIVELKIVAKNHLLPTQPV